MKTLYFTKYARNAGSSRLRSFQYIPYLEESGFKVEVSSLFSEKYLENLYSGKSTFKESLKGYIQRFLTLFSVGKYDVLIIEKELFPYLPACFEWFLKWIGVKYIVDYDDAIFHNYDQSSNPIIRNFLSRKIATVMKNASVVVAGNAYLADYAKNSGAKKIEIIPTVIDLDRYPQKKHSQGSADFIVGWVGTRSTFEKHLAPCKNWIRELEMSHPEIKFHVVGIPTDMGMGKNVKWIPWTEETETREILKMDVGIMPLEDSPWEKGKCAYKLIQYAACGIPGIASDVGMNKEVTIENETGFLVNTEEEWIKRIFELKNNPTERKRLGMNARKLVEEKYCIQVTAGKWQKLLNKTNGK